MAITKINNNALSAVTTLPFGTGKILQLVTATDNTQRETTSTSYVTASNTLSVTITPTSASNQIFIQVSATGYYSAAAQFGAYTLFKNGSNIITEGFSKLYNGNNAIGGAVQMAFKDTPGNTSAHTYEVRMKISSTGTVYLNANSGTYGLISAYEIEV